MGDKSKMQILLEQMDELSGNITAQYASGDNFADSKLDDESINEAIDDELMSDLNTVFTPILIMQSLEGNVEDKVKEELSGGNLLSERNCIKFSNKDRMMQLLSICALLIARKNNSEKFQMYKKAMEVVKSTKLEIQKSEYAAARVLAQKYLVKVATASESSVARKAANELLPLSN